MFNVSDKVVCIKDSWNPGYNRIGTPPVKGGVYVIEALINYFGSTGLRLVGRTSFAPNGIECGFCPENFRKLEEVQAENKAKLEVKELLEEVRHLKY